MQRKFNNLSTIHTLILTVVFILVLSPFAFAATYYVDYAGGSDSNNGTATGSALKRCPGDSGFSGSVRLQPGDTVIFKKGTTYSGKINTQSNSVTYTVGNWGSGDAVINGNGQDACFQVNHSSIKIDGGTGKNLALTGTTVKHAAIWNFAGSPLSGSAFTNLKVRDVGSTSSIEGIGIKIGGNSIAYTNYTISGNTITNSYSAGIKISGNGTSNIDIHHNTLEGNGRLVNELCQVNLSSNDGAGVQNVRFHDNVLQNGGARANGLNCNNANNQIYNNVITGHTGNGISVNPSYNTNYSGVTRVYNNTIRDNKGSYGIIIGGSNTSRHARIYNNLFINNGAYEVNLTSGAANNEIYNNTIYHTNTGHGIRIQGGATNSIIRNNIVWVNGGYVIYDSTGSIDENYNNLYRRDGGTCVVWGGKTYSTVGAYASATGQGRNSISVDPQFSDTTLFRLSGSSPCLNTAANLSSIFTTDKDGATRPGSQAWDMGPYETSGTSTTNPTTPTTPTDPTTPSTATSFAVRSGSIADIKAADGTIYATDKSFQGGSTTIFGPTVKGTTDPYLYRAERYGNFSYSIPLANGNYSLTLKFAEMYWTSPGQRVFSVVAQGQTIIANLDLVAKVGAATAYDVTVPVSVTNGILKLDFVTQIDNAKVSAIVVKRAS